MSTTKILVGSPTRIISFILSTRQLSFYSPYLRSLTETATSPSIPIVLRYHCPEVFQILVSWMDSPYNKNHLESKISVQDKHGIPLAFGLWILTKRLGGACLVLGDACMQWLYHEYTDGKCAITPMIAKYVLVYSRSHHDEVRLCVLGCLARDGAKEGGARERERVFEGVPGLKEFMEHTAGLTREVRREKVMEVDAYMCTPCPEPRQE
jgi:hypothetical protein